MHTLYNHIFCTRYIIIFLMYTNSLLFILCQFLSQTSPKHSHWFLFLSDRSIFEFIVVIILSGGFSCFNILYLSYACSKSEAKQFFSHVQSFLLDLFRINNWTGILLMHPGLYSTINPYVYLFDFNKESRYFITIIHDVPLQLLHLVLSLFMYWTHSHAFSNYSCCQIFY